MRRITLALKEEITDGIDKGCFPAKYSNDGSHYVIGSDSSVKVYNTSTWVGQELVTNNSTGARSLAFSNNGNWLAIGGMNGGVNVYNVSDWSLVQDVFTTARSIDSLCFSSDDSLLAFTEGGTTATLRIYETATWTEDHHETGIFDGFGLRFNADSSLLASGRYKDYSTRQIDLLETTTWTPAHTISLTSRQWDLEFSHDWSLLAVAMNTGRVHVYSTSNWSLIGVYGNARRPSRGVTFSPNDNTIALSHLITSSVTDAHMEFIDTATGKTFQVLDDPSDSYRAFAFNPSGDEFALTLSGSLSTDPEVPPKILIYNVLDAPFVATHSASAIDETIATLHGEVTEMGSHVSLQAAFDYRTRVSLRSDQVRFRYVFAGSGSENPALDSIRIYRENTLLDSEWFDTVFTGVWQNAAGNNRDWTRTNQVIDPGPSRANESSHYIYAPGQYANEGHISILTYDGSLGEVDLIEFALHMQGNTMGTLYLEAYQEGQWVVAWSSTGDLGNTWVPKGDWLGSQKSAWASTIDQEITAVQAYNANLSGLTPGTLHDFRAKVDYNHGLVEYTNEGLVYQFETLGGIPTPILTATQENGNIKLTWVYE